jgi:opacity protein-like surface antigen
MKKVITVLAVLMSGVAFAQKPMIGFSPNNIKQQNYIEFGTSYNSWSVDQGKGFYMMSTAVESTGGYAYYYFMDGAELNYRYALIMFDYKTYTYLRTQTIKGCTYQSGGWYKQLSSGLYIYFDSGVVDGKAMYTIIYSPEMYRKD